MIYFDNAATTMKKPDCVVQAVIEALGCAGNAERGVHQGSLYSSRIVYQTRKELAELFHAENPNQIAFSLNATESLNTAIKGTLKEGDHVITSVWEHNSLLRPLYEIKTELSFVGIDEKGNLKLEEFEKYIQKNTKAIICTHASNVTGNVVDLKWIGRLCRKHDLLFIVDASQSAGVFEIDVQKMNIDILCFTGHKGLYGPQGTGGLYVREHLKINPLKSGGSGILTYSKTQPELMPTVLEAGTKNVHGLAGLLAGLKYIKEIGLVNIQRKEMELMIYFYEHIKNIDGIKVYGDFTQPKCAIVALNVQDYDASLISDVLYRDYDIATRAGAHCAPLMHEALDTVNQGIVRFSFSYFNTFEEIDVAIKALKQILE